MAVKVRKTGNSTVITLPPAIQTALGVDLGEQVEFVTEGNSVFIRKVEPVFDLASEVEQAMTQYDELMKALVDQ